ATDDITHHTVERPLQCRIGDVRDLPSVVPAIRDADIVVNAAAMKQVPTCEYFPFEAVRTNIEGAENVVRAIEEHPGVETVIGVSTDKACKPVNTMGMTKAIQERIFVQGNMRCRRPASSACATATCSRRAAPSSRSFTSRSRTAGP